MNNLVITFGLFVFLITLSFGQSSIESQSLLGSSFEDDDLLWDRVVSGEAESGLPPNNRKCAHAFPLAYGSNNFHYESLGSPAEQGCTTNNFNAWYSYQVPGGSIEKLFFFSEQGSMSIFDTCGGTPIACDVESYVMPLAGRGTSPVLINIHSNVNVSGTVSIANVYNVRRDSPIVTVSFPSVVNKDDLIAAIGNYLGLPRSQWLRIVILENKKKNVEVKFTFAPSSNVLDPTPSQLARTIVDAITADHGALGASYTVDSAPAESNSNLVVPVISNTYISENPVCTQDSDCGGHGVCENFGCSCYSGFGDDVQSDVHCAALPDVSCRAEYEDVLANSSAFAPTYTLDVDAGILKLDLSAPLQQTMWADATDPASATVDQEIVGYARDTRIYWSTTSLGSQCNYPSTDTSGTSLWLKKAASAGNCGDKYYLEVPWAQARSECGFTYKKASASWTQEVTIVRSYYIPLNDNPDYKRSSLPRTEKITFQIEVKFPETVILDSSISVSGPQAVHTNALLNVIYVPVNNNWRLDITTYTTAPYHLTNEAINAGFAGRTVSVNSTMVGTCSDNTVGCSQLYTVYVSGCEALDDTLDISFMAVCNAGAGTCLTVTEATHVLTTLKTQSSCNAVHNVELAQKTLTSYKRVGMLPADASTSFKAQQTAYFASTITSTDATITSKSLKSVCIILTGTTTCVPVTYTVLTVADAMAPAFSVDLGQTRNITNNNDAQEFTVKATVALTWQDATGNKRSVDTEVDHIFDAQTRISVSDSTEDSEQVVESKSSSSVYKNATIVLTSVMGTACVLLVVVAAIYLRRKVGQKTESA